MEQLLDLEISQLMSLALTGTCIKNKLTKTVKRHINFFIFSPFHLYNKKKKIQIMSIDCLFK